MNSETFTVLLVDDDEQFRLTTGDVLEALSYDVLLAEDGDQGWEMAVKEAPDVILLDIMMPRLDGYELCRQLALSPETVDTPVIMVTGLSDFEAGLRAEKMGASDFITKPVEPQELDARIKRQLKRRFVGQRQTMITSLPGNIALERLLWERIVSKMPLAVCYVDVDGLATYNRERDFSAGDQVIRTLAEIIVRAVQKYGGDNDFVAHLGSDDFAVVTAPQRAEDIAAAVVTGFQTALPSFYDVWDLSENGTYVFTRRGNLQRHPLLSVSVGIVSNQHRQLLHAAQVAQIGRELLAYIKSQGGGNYMVDRRTGD